MREFLSRQLARNRTLAQAIGRGERDLGPVTLDRNRVFILPTRPGLLFAGVLLLMLLGSLNYNNNMGLMLTFLLSGMALVSILHTYYNLVRLTLRPGRGEPVFAGQQAAFAICLVNAANRDRYSLALQAQGRSEVYTDVLAQTTRCVHLSVPAPRRGRLRLGRFTIATRFPLGLFRAWSYLELNLECLVYPIPITDRALLYTHHTHGEGGNTRANGAEDFIGFRPYHAGDSPRHLYWKALAREQEPQTKQFASPQGMRLWLHWDELVGMDTEQRLSQLCRWVLDADVSGLSYGLTLPSARLEPDRGEMHRRRCLEALALYGVESED